MNIKEKILEFKTYEDNWNGYDAPPFSEKVISNALNLEKYLYYKKDELQPEIFPTSCNSLQIEYDYHSNYLEIEITEDCYSIFEEIDGKQYEFNIDIDKIYEVINIIKLFYQPKVNNMCLFTGSFNPPTISKDL